jgi:outer membrane protein assembly factor BamB
MVGKLTLGGAVLALVAAACSGGLTSATTAAEADPSTETWPTAGRDLANSAGRDLANSRALPTARLTADTIGQAAELWRAPLPDAGALSTVPLVVDGTVYLQGATGQVVALDLASGALEWASEPSGFNIGPFGVAVDDERVYALDGSQGVLALDRRDGTELWSTDVTTTPTLGIDIQPVVVVGLVLVSSVPVSVQGIYAAGDRGVIHALDAATGAVRWTFDTVEGDLWGHPEVNSGGGAWYPPAVDEERGLAYFGIANPAPFPGTPEWPNGSSRPGPNLYTDSVVALDLATGALRWYHQVTPHDLLDRDQVHVLLAEVDGERVVVSSGKSGVLVGLDPDDGTPLWEREVGEHRNDDLEALPGPTEVAPGTYGGVLTPPSSAAGVVYVAVVNAPATLEPDQPAYFGAEMGQAEGEVVAVAAADGEVLWSTPVPGDPLGGTAVVGDLVVTALLDGTLVALRRDGGDIAWTGEAGGGVNGWLAALDDRLIVPVGNGDPPLVLALGLRR